MKMKAEKVQVTYDGITKTMFRWPNLIFKKVADMDYKHCVTTLEHLLFKDLEIGDVIYYNAQLYLLKKKQYNISRFEIRGKVTLKNKNMVEHSAILS